MPLMAIARRRIVAAPTPEYQSILATYLLTNSNNCNDRSDCDLYAYGDGTLDRRRESYGTSSQIEYDQYCTITPTAGFGDDYHIKLTAQSGTSFFDATGSDALATWHALTSDRVWHFDEQDCDTTLNQLYDLEISDDGGSTTLDTTVITIRMSFDSP